MPGASCQPGSREMGGLRAHPVENLLQPLPRERRALDISMGPHLPCEPLTLFTSDHSLLLAAQLLCHYRAVSQIDLQPDEKTWDSQAVVLHLGEPLLLDVRK